MITRSFSSKASDLKVSLAGDGLASRGPGLVTNGNVFQGAKGAILFPEQVVEGTVRVVWYDCGIFWFLQKTKGNKCLPALAKL